MEDHRQRNANKARSLAAAPWADLLKQSPWTQTLFRDVTRAGHQRRTKVGLIWIGTTLRLEARGHRLELRPGSDGITAVFVDDGVESRSVAADLDSPPSALIDLWMPVLDAQKRLDDERAAQAQSEGEIVAD